MLSPIDQLTAQSQYTVKKKNAIQAFQKKHQPQGPRNDVSSVSLSARNMDVHIYEQNNVQVASSALYVEPRNTWNEACFGKGTASRKSCDGKNIPIICGCQQRVSQTWCTTNGMYEFPLDTPGSASVDFVTFQ